jgi:hypothetical protein
MENKGRPPTHCERSEAISVLRAGDLSGHHPLVPGVPEFPLFPIALFPLALRR